MERLREFWSYNGEIIVGFMAIVGGVWAFASASVQIWTWWRRRNTWIAVEAFPVWTLDQGLVAIWPNLAIRNLSDERVEFTRVAIAVPEHCYFRYGEPPWDAELIINHRLERREVGGRAEWDVRHLVVPPLDWPGGRMTFRVVYAVASDRERKRVQLVHAHVPPRPAD